MRYPVGRSRAANGLVAAIWAAGAICTGIAAFGLDAPGAGSWRAWVPCAAALLVGVLWLRVRRAAARGELVFDGRHWAFSLPGADRDVAAAGHVRIGLDLQRVALLRIDEPGRPGRWLWVDGAADPARWRDLRRALHAPALLDDPDLAGVASRTGRLSSTA